MFEFAQWEGFAGKEWKESINVRKFIRNNYTPYEGDSSFLAGPTARTNELMEKAIQKIFLTGTSLLLQKLLQLQIPITH